LPWRSFTVTSQTKEILGVTTTVVHDQAFVKGELVEDTLDWFAQDAAGNVWYFGEDAKELEDGVVVSTEGSWEAGVDGARANGSSCLPSPWWPGLQAGGCEERRRRLLQDRGPERLGADAVRVFARLGHNLVTTAWAASRVSPWTRPLETLTG
jgi:hypothetical protein